MNLRKTNSQVLLALGETGCLITMRLFIPIIIIIGGVLLIACNSGQKPLVRNIPKSEEHSLSTELRAFYDLSSLPDYLDSTYVAQISSYDTTGKNDDGFSGRYSFLRRNADSTLVIFYF